MEDRVPIRFPRIVMVEWDGVWYKESDNDGQHTFVINSDPG